MFCCISLGWPSYFLQNLFGSTYIDSLLNKSHSVLKSNQNATRFWLQACNFSISELIEIDCILTCLGLCTLDDVRRPRDPSNCIGLYCLVSSLAWAGRISSPTDDLLLPSPSSFFSWLYICQQVINWVNNLLAIIFAGIQCLHLLTLTLMMLRSGFGSQINPQETEALYDWHNWPPVWSNQLNAKLLALIVQLHMFKCRSHYNRICPSFIQGKTTPILVFINAVSTVMMRKLPAWCYVVEYWHFYNDATTVSKTAC